MLNNSGEMNVYLQLSMVLLALFFLLIMIVAVKKNKIDVRHSIGWFTLALFYLVLASFPQLMQIAADLLFIETPVNAVFLMNIAFLTIAVFVIFVSIAKTNKRVRLLIQEVSILKQHLQEKEIEYDAAVSKPQTKE